MNIKTELSKMLTEHHQKHGTYHDIVKKCNICSQQLERIAEGKSEPALRNLVKIVNYFGKEVKVV